MRYWVAIALAALVACNRGSAPAVGKPDAALYSYVPADATWVAGARIAAMRSSPVYEQLRGQLPDQALPYEKEASEIVMAGDGAHSIMLVRGKFDPQRLERDLRRHDADHEEVVKLADDLIAIGQPAMVTSAKRRAGSPLVKQIPSAQIWMLTNGQVDWPLPERSNLGNLKRLTEGLQFGSAAANLSDGVEVRAKLEFVGEPESTRMETAMKGFLGLARLSVPNGKEDMLKVLDGVRVERMAATVNVAADFAPELVKELLRSLPQRTLPQSR